MAETGNVRKFSERGIEAQRAADQIAGRSQAESDLQIAISAVQATIVWTEEDETRVRMRNVLKILQRMQTRVQASFGDAPK